MKNKNTEKIQDIIVFRPRGKKISVEVTLKEETVWLSLMQMASLFDRDKSVISRHLHNIFKSKELSNSSTVAFFATVQTKEKNVIVALVVNLINKLNSGNKIVPVTIIFNAVLNYFAGSLGLRYT